MAQAVSLAAVLLRTWRGVRSQTDVARLLRVDQARYSQFERGVRKPSRRLAVAIEAGTGGMVSVAAWDQEPPADADVEQAS